MERSLDVFDRRILDALQRDGALTNGALAELVHLSASQCSRRRTALEDAGYIQGYRANLNAKLLGAGLRVMVRLTLKSHDKDSEKRLSQWLAAQTEVQAAFSISGDADYILAVRVPDLDSFSDFIHEKLLLQPQIAQVRSDLVLKTLKDSPVIDLGL